MQPAIVPIRSGYLTDHSFKRNEVANYLLCHMTWPDALPAGGWHVDVVAQHGIKLNNGRYQTPA